MHDLEATKPFDDEYVDADVRFHQAIFRASGNELLMAMGNTLQAPLTLSFTLHSSLQVRPSNRPTPHPDILAAIAIRPTAAARAASIALTSAEAPVASSILQALGRALDRARARPT